MFYKNRGQMLQSSGKYKIRFEEICFVDALRLCRTEKNMNN